MGSRWPGRARVWWVILSWALMFLCAYFTARYLDAGFRVGDWIGLPQYANEVEKLQREALWFEGLAILLPFVAAFTLGLGRLPAGGPGAALVRLPYLARWGISLAGAFCFLLLIFFWIGYLGPALAAK